MRDRSFGTKLALGVLLFWPALALSQTAHHGGTLNVNGHDGQVPVVHMKGRSYVDIESLARLTNGSVSYKGNHIILTLPAAAASTSPTAPPAGQPANTGLSKDFVRAGIEEVALIREWRSALVSFIQNGYPVTDSWMARYRGPAESNLNLASVAASTDSDRKTFQLLSNEFNNMHNSSQRFVAARASLTYIPQNSLDNDPLDQKILNCAHALGSLASGAQFQDERSCH